MAEEPTPLPKVSYSAEYHKDGLAPEELVRLSRYGCDAFIGAAILHLKKDGTPYTDASWFTVDGRTGENMTPEAIFTAWASLGASLLQVEELTMWQRAIVSAAVGALSTMAQWQQYAEESRKKEEESKEGNDGEEPTQHR